LFVSCVIKEAAYARPLLFADADSSNGTKNEQSTQNCAQAADSVHCS